MIQNQPPRNPQAIWFRSSPLSHIKQRLDHFLDRTLQTFETARVSKQPSSDGTSFSPGRLIVKNSIRHEGGSLVQLLLAGESLSSQDIERQRISFSSIHIRKRGALCDCRSSTLQASYRDILILAKQPFLFRTQRQHDRPSKT